jgi:Flp pilus assembly protein TadG
MKKLLRGWHFKLNRSRCFRSLSTCRHSKGQALVEFTLIFVLLLVVAWIPADFGLAFYTAQLALNASREGARISAADPCLLGTNAAAGCIPAGIAAQTGTCTLPGCYSLSDGTVLKETAKRLSSALMPGAQITLAAPGGSTCNRQVTVTVAGQYNYSFYRFLRFFGVPVPATVTITRSTQMRWEHQDSCI